MDQEEFGCEIEPKISKLEKTLREAVLSHPSVKVVGYLSKKIIEKSGIDGLKKAYEELFDLIVANATYEPEHNREVREPDEVIDFHHGLFATGKCYDTTIPERWLISTEGESRIAIYMKRLGETCK